MHTAVTVFSSIQVGPYTLPNRIALAPLTRNRAGQGNVPQALNVEYYAQRSGAGLIITEATQVSPQGVGYPATPGIHSAEQVAGWRRVTDTVHAKGGHIFLQLWHVGRISHPALQPDGALPVAPSALKPAGQAITYEGPKDFVTPRALELAELPGIVEQYRSGAQNALAAGFDGVEIHGANGYLLDQFLRDGSNQRTDAYGGSIENRARLMLEVTGAVCSVWGANRVGIRLSPLQPFNDMRDSNPEATFSYAVEQLNRFGLAYLHVTEMGKDAPGAAGPAFDLGKLRRIWKGVYMTNGGYDLARANAALAKGEADMVAFGVLFLANPDLPLRFARGAPLNTPDQATFYGGNAQGYTDYPFMGAL
ncbi:MAG: alkene reductase [Gammaproteobacteria bacterium]|nr:alkene reductase [Gammaproteobacteria bacterium]